MRSKDSRARRGPRVWLAASRQAKTTVRQAAIAAGLTLRQVTDAALEDVETVRLAAERVKSSSAPQGKGEADAGPVAEA